MLDPNNTDELYRDACFFECLATCCMGERFARLDSSSREIPQFAMLALVNEQEAISLPHNNERVVPTWNGITGH
jgi:hypothetical protein